MSLSSDSLRLLARSAKQTVREPLGRGVDAATLAAWLTDLPPAIRRIDREATVVGLLGHLEGDLARGVVALYGAALLPDNADAHIGSLLRIVHTTKDADLEIYQSANDRRTWRDAHPDPVPPLRARATGLQAERAALTDEDKTLTQKAQRLAHHVSQLQQEVIHLNTAVSTATADAEQARQALEASQHALDRANEALEAARAHLPDVLKERSADGIRALSAAVLAPFHPRDLERLAHQEAVVKRARQVFESARSVFNDCENRVSATRSRQTDHEQKLLEARRAHARANRRRDTLRARASHLSHKRLRLARQMDAAADAHHSSLTDELARQLHGDPRGRLRLRWPHGGLDPRIIALVAPGTHADDAVVRRSAEDALATRADALLVCASLQHPPDAERVRAVQRMARHCPRVGLVFYDTPIPSQEAAAACQLATDRWAAALHVTPDRILAVFLSRCSSAASPEQMLAATGDSRKERTALGEALLEAPPVARAAGLAHAIHSTARRVDAEIRRMDASMDAQEAVLMSQRISDVDQFAMERRPTWTRSLQSVVERARVTTADAIKAALQQLETDLLEEVRGTSDRLHLDAVRAQLVPRLEQIWRDVDDLGRRTARRTELDAVDQLMDVALAPLSDRVRLTTQASRPPNAALSEADDLDDEFDEVFRDLRAAIDAPPEPASKAALTGGAIGAALLGPLGALLGAGAGVVAHKLGAGTEKRRQETVDLIRRAFQESTAPLVQHSLERFDGAEARIAQAVDARLVPCLKRFMEWWLARQATLQRHRDAQRRSLQRLARTRDALLDQATKLEASIADQARLAGVFVAPADSDSLPPPPSRA